MYIYESPSDCKGKRKSARKIIIRLPEFSFGPAETIPEKERGEAKPDLKSFMQFETTIKRRKMKHPCPNIEKFQNERIICLSRAAPAPPLKAVARRESSLEQGQGQGQGQPAGIVQQTDRIKAHLNRHSQEDIKKEVLDTKFEKAECKLLMGQQSMKERISKARVFITDKKKELVEISKKNRAMED
jgi:hypothetical protein